MSASPDAAIAVPAPAKINLYLHVLGRRADGYHLLNSLVAFAQIGDEIELYAADVLSLAVEGPFAPALSAADDNLVLAAARRLAAAYDVSAGARIVLRKNLPVAAGIGGGSADAAAALKGLCRLWGIAAEARELSALGLALGADVPVCLVGRAATMSGIGETIEPIADLPICPVVLVNPGIPLSTRDVFAALKDYSGAPPPLGDGFRDVDALATALAATVNDLALPARAVAPAIGDALDALSAAPGCLLSRLSGSGPTCFGLFAGRAAAAAAARTIAAAHPRWWVRESVLS